MKRGRSTETDEDSYDEQEFQKDGCPSQSYHISDRKKRRGVIEKRRRDRINNSLCELRRLVPAAFEKQGSAKLEKAEILQMTVDHLKLLHSRGLGGYNVEAASIALDCRMTGFRECAAEVARYLVSVEGLELQDPLRLRLIGHLQCYCAQRESAAVAKATPHPPPPPPPWNNVTRTPNFVGGHHYGGHSASSAGPGGFAPARTPQHGAMMHQHDQSSSSAAAGGYVVVDQAARLHHAEGPVASSSGHVHGRLSSSGAQMAAASGAMMMPGGVLPGVHSQFFGVNSMAMLSPNGLQYHHHHHSASSSVSSSSSSNLLGQSVKPYRPWGAELVY